MRQNIVTKKHIYLYCSFIILFFAFYLQYSIDLPNLLKKWNTDDFSYCYVVPFIVIYLVYMKLPLLKSNNLSPSLSGLLVLLCAGILYFAGRTGSIETLVFASIWATIIGIALLILGSKIVKDISFPLFILIFIVPLPPFLNNLFTFKLKLYSSMLAVKFMRFLGLSVYLEGNVIDLWVTKLQVVDACSGLRYVYPLFLMALVFAYLFHKKLWIRTIIILAAVPISVLSNSLRIAIMGYLTIKVSPQIADTFFHGFSGWLIFMLSFGFLAILSRILKFFESKTSKKKQASTINKSLQQSINPAGIKASYLLAASFIILFFWGLNTAFDSARTIPDRKTFENFPLTIGDWKGKRSYLDKNILNSLWSDDYVSVEFYNKKTGDILLLLVPYYEYQATRHTVHSPVSCLVGGGYAPLSRTLIRRDFPQPYGKVKIRQMILEKNNQFLLSNYWFQQRGRILVSEYRHKWFLFLDSIFKNRTDGALVRIEMPLKDRDFTRAQAVVDSFTTRLMEILPEYIPN